MSTSPKAPRRSVSGVLLLDKPAGAGSNSVLQQVKRLFNAQKAGHTGTLDPMATGLLPICFGEATKFSAELLDAEKSYLAIVQLGIATDSGDAEGAVVAQQSVKCTFADIVRIAEDFRGEIKQVPPMYSALKRDGKPLYEYARQGIELPRDARSVRIAELEIRALDAERFEMFVRCSKGTYIRSLAMDIGERLGCGAHLTALRRTSIGRFGIDDAITLEQLTHSDLAHLDQYLHSIDHLVLAYPVLKLQPVEAVRLVNGQRFRPESKPPQEGYVRLYDPSDRFLGLGRYVDGILHPERLLAAG